jgi:hypothetical protein
MVVLTKMFHELPRLVAGHASSSLAATLDERLTRLRPDIDRQRLVIDPKYDTCTKRRASRTAGRQLWMTLPTEGTVRPSKLLLSYFSAIHAHWLDRRLQTDPERETRLELKHGIRR